MHTRNVQSYGVEARRISNRKYREFYPFIVGVLTGSGWIILGMLDFEYSFYKPDQFTVLLFSFGVVLIVLALLLSLIYCLSRKRSALLVLLASGMIGCTLLLLTVAVFRRFDPDAVFAGGIVLCGWLLLVPVASSLLWAGIVIDIIPKSKQRIFLLLSLLPLSSIPFMDSIHNYGHIPLGIICIIVGIIVYLGGKRPTRNRKVMISKNILLI